MRRVVRGVHQAHFTWSVTLCMVEIKSWLIAQFNKIDSAATNIRDVSYQLHDVGNRLSESLLDIQNKLTNIDIAQQELNKKISDRNVKLDVKDLIKDLSNKS